LEVGTEEMNNHTVGLGIQFEITRWFEPRNAQGLGSKVVGLMPLMFRTLDALYLVTRKLPIVGISGARKNKAKDKPNVFTFGLILEASKYATLRSILALAGDLILVSNKLMTLPNLLELGQFILHIHKQAEKFEDTRNFFTHMDEALGIIQDMQYPDLSLWIAVLNSRLMPKIMFI
jgi:hypothetical protein